MCVRADLERVVATDSAFLVGRWLEAAKAWGVNSTDCGDMACEAFYEWNARSQITTWTPVNWDDVDLPNCCP